MSTRVGYNVNFNGFGASLTLGFSLLLEAFCRDDGIHYAAYEYALIHASRRPLTLNGKVALSSGERIELLTYATALRYATEHEYFLRTELRELSDMGTKGLNAKKWQQERRALIEEKRKVCVLYLDVSLSLFSTNPSGPGSVWRGTNANWKTDKRNFRK